MMGGVSPETCWTSYKQWIINFDTVLYLVGYFYMNYTMMHGSTNVKLAVHWMAVDVAPDSLSTKHADIITTLHITEILTNETYNSKMTSCLIKEDIWLKFKHPNIFTLSYSPHTVLSVPHHKQLADASIPIYIHICFILITLSNN